MLLFLTGLNFILILYGFTSGDLPTVPEFINDLCVAALVIYAVMMCLYTSHRKSHGLELLSLIPVFTFVAYLIASFVSVTEMAVTQTYILMIFSICSLILFFFYDAKGFNLNKRRNVAGVFGFLSFVFLCGQYIPMLIVPALSSVTANTFMLTDILMGIALIIFTFTYSLYLLDQ
ncbi:hypothetical protein SDC9_170058 [bioreactor metagenome]|uniref:Uncharacterized protein n=1 Tax=bioreactor metagenome TaxID=1076179 RepID=A0A645G7R3_9ZZZZ